MKRRKDGRYTKMVKGVIFYGNSTRELNRKIIEHEEANERGRTFACVADEWWGDAMERLSPTSVRGYRVAYERAVEEFGDAAIQLISARAVSAFLQRLARKGYAKSTVKNHKIVLSRIFNHALVTGDIYASPCQGVEVPRGLPVKRRRAASPEDEAKIRATANVWVLPYLALMTGMRKGELLALQWRDVDFESNTISVTKSLYYEGNAHIKSPKTDAGRRVIPLLSGLKAVLLPMKGKPTHYVVSDTGDKPLSQKRFRTLYKHYCEKTGVTATLHQLRKSFATVAVQHNIPPKVLQAIIGHKNIATTLDIYAEVRADALSDAAKVLDEALK